MIKLLVLDVDGCMTDGSIIYDTNGNELKKFNVKDGLAIASWIRMGRKVAIITGRQSKVIEKRASELGIKHLYQSIKDKGAVLSSILTEENLSQKEVAAIGDDLNDLKMFALSHISFTPNNGSKLLDPYITTRLQTNGGEGAIREMIENILTQENKIEEFVSLWQ
jgi:3-deoxy-D-manno-octulosonate 8-phosphate phosphatase (KDO 8-P phosphatase)